MKSPPPADLTSRANRAAWDAWADDYQMRHGPLLRGDQSAAWGLWRLPEESLRLLGDVSGQDVLELGCGAGYWSRALGLRNPRTVTALDISSNQLRHASSVVRDAKVCLIQGDAERLPLRDGCIDLIFSDYGGMSWGQPNRTIPEAARVLRDGGRLVFCTHSPFFFVFWNDEAQRLEKEPQRPYFEVQTRIVRGIAVDHQLPHGEWISLMRGSGLLIEQLLEVRPPDEARTSFRDRPLEWARKWPMEDIWVATKGRRG